MKKSAMKMKLNEALYEHQLIGPLKHRRLINQVEDGEIEEVTVTPEKLSIRNKTT